MLAEKLSHCAPYSLVISNAASSKGLLVGVVIVFVVVSLDSRIGEGLARCPKVERGQTRKVERKYCYNEVCGPRRGQCARGNKASMDEAFHSSGSLQNQEMESCFWPWNLVGAFFRCQDF